MIRRADSLVAGPMNPIQPHKTPWNLCRSRSSAVSCFEDHPLHWNARVPQARSEAYTFERLGALRSVRLLLIPIDCLPTLSKPNSDPSLA